MAQEIQPWRPSTTSLPDRAAISREILSLATSPRQAVEAAKQLVGQWPHARPPDPDIYAASLAAVLAAYPLGLVQECVDPRRGMARVREFPPTVAALVEWCDERLNFHQTVAQYKGQRIVRVEPDYSSEHRETMLKRLSKLMHDTFDAVRA